MTTKAATPFDIDPTRSISLRRSFSQGLTSTFNIIAKEIRNLIVEEDALGLRIKPLPTMNGDYSSTQFDVKDKEVLREIERIQDTLSPEDVRELEDIPHVTIRYGLFDQPYMVESIRSMVWEMGPIAVRIGELSTFQTEEGDVLKFDIESAQLRELNARLKLLPNYERFGYHPHMTVAYLSSGKGEQYVQSSSITGKTLIFDTLVYSDSERNREEILLANKRWKYKSQSEMIEEFGKWVDAKVTNTLLSASEALKWKKFIEKGFNKGAARAFDDTSKVRKQAAKESLRASGFTEGRREQFIRSTLGKATAVEKLKLLNTRALSEVKGMSQDLRTKARRVLTEGLVRSLSPRDIAANLVKEIGVSKGRAETIAYTELVRAHADGQLEAMEQMGVKEVGVAVEWSTAENPCKTCQPLKGIVLTIAEAKGMLPRHPRCRCAWLPANVGEERTEQKRGKYKIDKAIAQSQKREEQDTDWGPDKVIKRKRPKPIINVACSCSEVEFESMIRNIFCTENRSDS